MAFLENGIKGRTVHNGSLWGDAPLPVTESFRLPSAPVQK